MTAEEQQYCIDLVPFMNPAPYSVPDVSTNIILFYGQVNLRVVSID